MTKAQAIAILKALVDSNRLTAQERAQYYQALQALQEPSVSPAEAK